ncbi:MAG: hypothetical protein ACI8WB_005503 [Phenylobacterium sp.]|jgi:hypothetical protein
MNPRLKPEVVPIGGYNLEYRQSPSTSEGYIYSHSSGDAAAFQSTFDDLPATNFFSDKDSRSKFTKQSAFGQFLFINK